jgi:hypothetical protein
MKIDAFSLDLSSSRTYSTTQTTQVSEGLSFMKLVDSRMAAAAGKSPQVFAQQPQQMSPTDAFLAELTAMRQIMDDILAVLRNHMAISGFCRNFRMEQAFIQPVSGRYTAMAWESKQTVSVSYEAAEQTRVSASGTVQTADNQEIDFSLDLSMARQFSHKNVTQQTASGGVLVDPLVVRTNASAPLLTGGQFSFDLDLDDTAEDLFLPGTGTAFLALDLNGDGQINDGSELFGPSTGDGFAELAQYDADSNQWIDENDGIFDDLTLWEQDGGAMTLTGLKAAGIGAIYLDGISSLFNLTSSDNQMRGQVAKTSIALTEAGKALPVHEVDYAVSQAKDIA